MSEIIWLSPDSEAEFKLNPWTDKGIEWLVSAKEDSDYDRVLAILKQAVMQAPDNPASYLERLSTQRVLPESCGL